jgi:hypothetical protein
MTQTNVVAVVSDGSNESSTTQSGAEAPGQAASTGQTAGSTATATQDQPGNIIVSVRINSPGNNGSSTQTNGSGAASNASNSSATGQGAPAVAKYDGTDDTSRDTPVAIGPPAKRRQAAPPPASSTPAGRRASSSVAPTPPGRTSHGSSAARVVAPAGGGDDVPSAATAAAPSAGTSSPAAVLRETRHAKRASHPAPRQTKREVRSGTGIRSRAADLLFRSLAPRRALPPAGESSEDVSPAVLLTVIALLGAALGVAGSARLGSGRRLLDPRNWWGR